MNNKIKKKEIMKKFNEIVREEGYIPQLESMQIEGVEDTDALLNYKLEAAHETLSKWYPSAYKPLEYYNIVHKTFNDEGFERTVIKRVVEKVADHLFRRLYGQWWDVERFTCNWDLFKDSETAFSFALKNVYPERREALLEEKDAFIKAFNERIPYNASWGR